MPTESTREIRDHVTSYESAGAGDGSRGGNDHGPGQGLASDSRVDSTTHTGTASPAPPPISPTGTTIHYSTPDSVNCSFDSSFGSSSRVVDCRSPSRTGTGSRATAVSPEAGEGSPTSNGADSSYELVQRTTPSGSCRSSSTPSFPHSIPLNPSAPQQSNRSRALSVVVPRHSNARGATTTLLRANDRIQRRASHDGVPLLRPRTSLTPILSPIPDATDDRTTSRCLLDPTAESVSPMYRSASLPFPEDVSFDYIIENGKTRYGDLTKEARAAMSRLGLKSIPSFHGPLSLPYARCPSGIDAFLISAEKDEDPWTFVFEGDAVRPSVSSFTSGRRTNVPLPGNSRYSQPGHVSSGRLPTRIVSAPAELERTASRRVSSDRSKYPEVDIGGQHHSTHYPHSYPSDLVSPGMDLPPHQTASTTPAYPAIPFPGAYPYPFYPYPGFPFPYPHPSDLAMYTNSNVFTTYAGPPTIPQQPLSTPTIVPRTPLSSSFVDPAIISYTHEQSPLPLSNPATAHAQRTKEDDTGSNDKDDNESTAVDPTGSTFFFPSLPLHPRSTSIGSNVLYSTRFPAPAPARDQRRSSAAPSIPTRAQTKSTQPFVAPTGGGENAASERRGAEMGVEKMVFVPHRSRPRPADPVTTTRILDTLNFIPGSHDRTSGKMRAGEENDGWRGKEREGGPGGSRGDSEWRTAAGKGAGRRERGKERRDGW